MIDKENKLPVKMADFILLHEEAIRRAVEEKRQEPSFLRAQDFTGAGPRRSGKSDQTARQAVAMTEELPFVTLYDGGTVKRPESWLACLEKLRKKAEANKQSKMIFEVWVTDYRGGLRGASCLTPETWRYIKIWIRYHLLMLGKEKGLISLSEEAIMESVKSWDGLGDFFRELEVSRKKGRKRDSA